MLIINFLMVTWLLYSVPDMQLSTSVLAVVWQLPGNTDTSILPCPLTRSAHPFPQSCHRHSDVFLKPSLPITSSSVRQFGSSADV